MPHSTATLHNSSENVANTSLNRIHSIAPMIDCTDRHYRYLMRLITRETLLYTEMITTGAILHGDEAFHLGFDDCEHPVALQLGGSDPELLAQCAKIGEAYGYDEINLNVGCPSDRVQSGRFGACLMAEPKVVGECVAAMRAACDLPVTVKSRTGIDKEQSYETFTGFIKTVAEYGCETFIVHARNAWLKGLSPKDNRTIPPLKYEFAYQLKQDMPELEVILNGGIKAFEHASELLDKVDGVMIGRAAYSMPFMYHDVDSRFYGKTDSGRDQKQVIRDYLPYVEAQLAKDVNFSLLIRPLLGIVHGMSGGKRFRRFVSENGHKKPTTETLENALRLI